jgi:hypothetical protein
LQEDTMDTPKPPDRQDEPAVDHAAAAPRAYEPPRLIEYGPLAKITQGAVGSTGETSNKKKKTCL